MTLLEAITQRRAEVVGRLTAEFVRLGNGQAVRCFVMEEDGALELASEMTGLVLTDGEAEAVFTLLDVLCREASSLAGFLEWLKD